MLGTPIIHSPQAAMHATKDKPAIVNGRIVIRPIMMIALTYDDRYGRGTVTFLGW